jgi:hypothetical protein
MDNQQSRLRRAAPLLLVLAVVAWIITVVVLILVSPMPQTGNPMD